ncbi:hypothetical protein G3I19_12410 [Streptomyces sp. SID10853]|nr:hypothetical protein [Streptomyces sp. SID10853]NDZ79304.1 hypothetical protein [Streptomyces sp. SID10853]
MAGVTEVVIDWLERDTADDTEVLADHLTGFSLALLSGHWSATSSPPQQP